MELINPQAFLIIAIVALVLIAAALLVFILFLLNLKRMLDQVNPDNRMVPPANVFLMLIPVFSLVYGFILFPKISESLRREYESRGMTMPGDGLKVLGSAFAGLSLFSMIVNYLETPLSAVVSIALLVIFIVYWVKSAQIKNALRSSGPDARADLLD
jgi:hypothetical protein